MLRSETDGGIPTVRAENDRRTAIRHRRRFLATTVATFALLTASACGSTTGVNSSPTDTRQPAGPSSGTAQAPPATTSPATVNPPDHIVTCASADNSQPARLRPPGPGDLTVGSVSFPGLLTWANADAKQYGLNDQYKVGLHLGAGHTATVSIPDSYRTVAGLLYAQSSRDAATPAQADHSVTFVACPDRDTMFVGGFFVLTPRCVPIEIQNTPDSAPAQRIVSFFAGHCPSA